MVVRLGQALCLAVAVYHLFVISHAVNFLGFFIPMQINSAISLAGALACALLVPNTPRSRRWYDWAIAAALAAAGLTALGFVVFDFDRVLLYSVTGSLDQLGMIMAGGLALVLIESVRREAGIALPVIIVCLLSVVVLQPHMPGILFGRGYPPDRLLHAAFVGTNGIFGLPLRVAAETIIAFVIFGAMISASGAGTWFLNLALALTGRQPGGPAKAAVVASAMFGSISGSPSANAASTGVLTIPLMIRIGYSKPFSGAVEAVASTGGMILPPVMGSIAFLMAEWIGITYAEVVKAAIIPALLYYTVLYVSVHLQARRSEMRSLSSSELPPLMNTLRRGWFYSLPILLLCILIFYAHFPVGMAAILCIPVTIAVSFLSSDRDNWLWPKRIAQALIDAVHVWKGIAVITAAVGILVGALDLSGVGLNISRFLVDLSGGNLFLTLLMVGAAALVLGMGLDVITAYITLATLLAPALISLGVTDAGAHLFVIYWSLASFFTPPLCLAVFVTCSISGGNIWQTGWEAMKLGAGVFLIPMAFALEPALLLNGDPTEIFISAASAFLGAVALAAATRRYALAPLTAIESALVGVGAVALIYPSFIVSLIGLVTIAVTLIRPRFFGRTKVVDTSNDN